jgi:hypothetical protein
MGWPSYLQFAAPGGFRYSDGHMNAWRRRVHAIAIVWLLCQAASLAAFVPGQCCASHAAQVAAKQQAENCHETAPPEPKQGDACPMHHSKSHDCCAMTNACDGPGSHLLSLFALSGVVETPSVSSIVLESAAAYAPPQPPLLHHRSIPDAPPPKA